MQFSKMKRGMTKEKGYTWHQSDAPKTKNEYALQCFQRGQFQFMEIFEDGDEVWGFDWNGGPLARSSGTYLVRKNEVIGFEEGDLRS